MSSVLCNQTITGNLSLSGSLTLSTTSFATIQIGSANTYKIVKDTGGGNTLEIYSGNAMGPTLEMNSSRESTFYGSVDIANGGDLSVGDDLTMGSSGALLTLGNSSTVTLQHNGGFGGTLASNSTSGEFIIDSAHDITLDADGGQVYLKDGGTTRYTFNLDSTPELDVTGDFTIDGSGDITIDAADDLLLKSGAGTHIALDESTTGGANTRFEIKTYYPDDVKAIFGTGQSSDGDWHIYANGGTNSDLVIESLASNTGVGNIILRNKYQGDIEFADVTSTIFRMDNSSNALIVNSGNITLEGTGRIQGIDTVSASTDAANKAYVDSAVSGGGSVQAFQTGGFYHSNSSSSSTVYWIPTNYISEVTSTQYYNTWVAPHDGQVKKIIMRWSNGTTPTATSVTFRYSLNGTLSGSTFTPTTTNGGTTSMQTVMNFTGLSTIQFNEGDKFKLGFTTDGGGTRRLYGFAYTVQLEYDI